jgi:hypothetical protein
MSTSTSTGINTGISPKSHVNPKVNRGVPVWSVAFPCREISTLVRSTCHYIFAGPSWRETEDGTTFAYPDFWRNFRAGGETRFCFCSWRVPGLRTKDVGTLVQVHPAQRRLHALIATSRLFVLFCFRFATRCWCTFLNCQCSQVRYSYCLHQKLGKRIAPQISQTTSEVITTRVTFVCAFLTECSRAAPQNCLI